MPKITGLAAHERETVITLNDGDDLVRISTARPTDITAMRKKPHRFTEVASGFHGSTQWAEFTIPKSDWRVASGAKRQVSDETRQKQAEWMRMVTEARSASVTPDEPITNVTHRTDTPKGMSSYPPTTSKA